MTDTMEVNTGKVETTGRLLWLTDTFGDHNGVSTVLKAILLEIRRRNLPVDLLVCSNTMQPEDHLLVVRPVTEFTLPLYRQQPFRIPNYLSVQRTFRRGNYTRVICSTEGPMGLAAIWLKKVFPVEIFFYLHTDWLIFAKEVVSLEQKGINRLQRMLKFYYKRFGNVFVLNTDHQQWLTGKTMGFDASRVFLTAHWADRIFSEPSETSSREILFDKLKFDSMKPVILYTGRISKEKGVLELPGIVSMIRSVVPEMQMVIAGTGPAEEELKKAMPDALYLGWVDREHLPALYLSADLLLLPSRFDTFSCVVLEALSSGLPVVAYNAKGPKDILEDSVNGFLVESAEEMAGKVIGYFLDPESWDRMKQAALQRAEAYQADKIMDRLLQDVGLRTEACTL
ncbi:MAG: glycosyltransferase [Bacteroidetes bacterium]|nr:glycosyltransferase [Bacteroidota bacterium]